MASHRAWWLSGRACLLEGRGSGFESLQGVKNSEERIRFLCSGITRHHLLFYVDHIFCSLWGFAAFAHRPWNTRKRTWYCVWYWLRYWWLSYPYIGTPDIGTRYWHQYRDIMSPISGHPMLYPILIPISGMRFTISVTGWPDIGCVPDIGTRYRVTWDMSRYRVKWKPRRRYRNTWPDIVSVGDPISGKTPI